MRRKSNCCPSQQARSGVSGMEAGIGCVAGKQLEKYPFSALFFLYLHSVYAALKVAPHQL